MRDPKEDPKPSDRQQDWRDLAEQASKEPNPQKLVRLVEHLCDELDHRGAQGKLITHDKP